MRIDELPFEEARWNAVLLLMRRGAEQGRVEYMHALRRSPLWDGWVQKPVRV